MLERQAKGVEESADDEASDSQEGAEMCELTYVGCVKEAMGRRGVVQKHAWIIPVIKYASGRAIDGVGDSSDFPNFGCLLHRVHCQLCSRGVPSAEMQDHLQALLDDYRGTSPLRLTPSR